MPKPTDIRIVDVNTETENFEYRTPMKFGGRVVTDVVLLHSRIEVETRDGRRAEGFGSMPMSNVWAWPSAEVPSAEVSGESALKAMIDVGRRVAELAGAYAETAHPLEITHDLAGDYQSCADEVTGRDNLAEPMPRLAQLVAASPIEAAIHDAFGKALGENAYNLLGETWANRDLAAYLTDEFAGEYLDRLYAARAKGQDAAVPPGRGARPVDRRRHSDNRIDDGLPETLPSGSPPTG